MQVQVLSESTHPLTFLDETSMEDRSAASNPSDCEAESRLGYGSAVLEHNAASLQLAFELCAAVDKNHPDFTSEQRVILQEIEWALVVGRMQCGVDDNGGLAEMVRSIPKRERSSYVAALNADFGSYDTLFIVNRGRLEIQKGDSHLSIPLELRERSEGTIRFKNLPTVVLTGEPNYALANIGHEITFDYQNRRSA